MKKAVQTLLLAVLAFTTAAQARPVYTGYAVQFHQPSDPGDSFLVAPSASVGVPLQLVLRLSTIYGSGSLLLADEASGQTVPEGVLLRDQLSLQLDAALALSSRLQLVVGIPFALYQSGDTWAAGAPSVSGGKFGDLRAGARLVLLGAERAWPAVAVQADVWLPTGSKQDFTSDGRARFHPRLIASGRVAERFTYAAGVGMMMRPRQDVRSGSVGNAVTWTAGAAVELMGGQLQVGPEVNGSSSLVGDAVPVEGLLGARYRTGPVAIGAVTGAALSRAPGAARVRAALDVTWYIGAGDQRALSTLAVAEAPRAADPEPGAITSAAPAVSASAAPNEPDDQTNAAPTPTCLIAGVSRASGERNPSNACEECRPEQDAARWTGLPAGTPCASDTLDCTADACSAAGLCEHALVAGCLIGGTCIEAGAKDPGDPSRACVPRVATDRYTALAMPAVASAETQRARCVIGGVVLADGAVDPENPCQVCAAAQSRSAWSARAAGTACPDDGRACTSDQCDGGGRCEHPVQQGCLIDGTCFAARAENPADPSRECNPALAVAAWSAKPAKAARAPQCGSDADCGAGKRCVDGGCVAIPPSPGGCSGAPWILAALVGAVAVFGWARRRGKRASR